ncbi:hypothetical protein RJ640_027314 [Escallonia rubra]|uniref:Methyltransferase n=1 Tax=Escallonia rubra TaxID=112253 RepID=A0AA88R771_9ASTE|nr:hypothetical protein RJ640_027314 [Escallonia rubra]
MATRANFPSMALKKTNLFYMALTAVFCSFFYLVGIWFHGGATGGAAKLLPTIPCHPSQNTTTRTAKPLDFTSHHQAEDLVPTSTAARVVQIPPCDPKFSEYTPCEDVNRSLKFDRDRLIYRERHCPEKNELLKCRIPAPYGYRTPFRWPESRDSVWYANVPHKHLTVEKAGQNWVRFEGDRFTFPGGGTMFPRGADAYIDDIGKLIDLSDGSVRTAIDTGCGVASWGAYLLSRNILAMSFAPKDTHVAQVQFALERGVPAQIGVLASNRLPYPSRAFDMAHCSRCLIPWGIAPFTLYFLRSQSRLKVSNDLGADGVYLLEVDRILRPGGYWILSGPPINWERHWKGWNRTLEELKAEQDGIESLARSLCWKKLKQRDELAVWQKPTNHVHCKINRKVFKYTKMETCLTPLPEVSDIKETAGGQLARWPERLTAVPPRIMSGTVNGISADIFEKDTDLWKKRLLHYKALDYQLAEPGRYRNLLDMNSYLGGFAAALVDYPVWVMNVVPVEAQVNTLGVIYERGLIGTYQNWCEAMSTYPRTYDFIHADALFSLYNDRCELEDILLEMDRLLRPQGSVIIRDDVDVLVNVKSIVDGLNWESKMVDSEGSPHAREKILIATKQYWTLPAATDQGHQGSDSAS